MEELNKVLEAGSYISSKLSSIPETAVILGSGLGTLAEEVKDPVIIEYKDIPHFPVSTVEGHRGCFVVGTLGQKQVLLMQGRFHYYEGYDMNKVTMPVLVLKQLGIQNIIVTNAAGGVNRSFKPGDLMLIRDHINYSGTNPLIGPNLKDFGPRFPDMSTAYNRDFISKAYRVASQYDIHLVEGVYMMFTGPSYETPSEVKMAGILGGDAVGMSTVPEVIVANYCGLHVLGISCITNMAAGILDKPLDHSEVMETSKEAGERFRTLVKGIVESL